MIPSRTWFPGTLQDRAAWYDNFNTQVGGIGLTLGLTAGDITELGEDNGNIQAIASNTVGLEAYSDAMRQYRIIFTEGDIGDTIPDFPASPTFSVPTPSQPTGAFERLVKLVDRIRASAAYTDEIGALLGILPASTPVTPVEDLKPVLKASESVQDYKFTINVTRLGMPGYKVQIQRKGASTWEDVAFATSNPCEVTVAPSNGGDSERILVRAQLIDKNSPVGIPSDPTFVTINP